MLDLGSFSFFSAYRYFSQMCILYVCTSHTSLHGVYLVSLYLTYLITRKCAFGTYVCIIPHYTSVRLYHTYYRFYSADVYMVCLYLITRWYVCIIPMNFVQFLFCVCYSQRGEDHPPCSMQFQLSGTFMSRPGFHLLGEGGGHSR